MATAFDEAPALPASLRVTETEPTPKTLHPGERALMIAVLEDAVRCYLGLVQYDRTNPEILARQSEHWLRLEDWESPFSFNNICESLGLEPETTRKTILGWDRHRPSDLEARIRLLHTEAAAYTRSP